MKKMAVNLREVINNIKEHSERVSSASSEMTDVCEQQSKVATNSAAENVNEIAEGSMLVSSKIDKINSNMNILDSAIKDINEKSDNVSSAVHTASSYSEKGSEALHKVNSSMVNIQGSVNDTSKVIDKLGEHSQAIGKITE
ncbi:methyl-accepting chemotaxis protein [Clostridium beijerinckii]|nr:hypothetical protein [Clostridium beijerinckii]NOW34911.1 methyl-accepting chemotaxis protein [Clostridium beijerinckii]